MFCCAVPQVPVCLSARSVPLDYVAKLALTPGVTRDAEFFKAVRYACYLHQNCFVIQPYRVVIRAGCSVACKRCICLICGLLLYLCSTVTGY